LNGKNNFGKKKLIHSTHEIYASVVDTTFAVYNKKHERKCGAKSKFNAIRVANEFTAIHYPWMVDDPMPEEELKEYLVHDKEKVSTWGHGSKIS